MATNKRKTMIDARGQEVPVQYVGQYDKAKDRTVRRIEANARKLKEQMRAFLADAVKAMTELSGLKVWESGVTSRRGASTRRYRSRSARTGICGWMNVLPRRGS